MSGDLEREGSSPLAGRRRRCTEIPRPRGRLIPARGETTVAGRVDPAGVQAHPRSRGDDSDLARAAAPQGGSSPLAGRRRTRPPGRKPLAGLIPARGETTRRPTGLFDGAEAHPRSRGDDPPRQGTLRSSAGSSPLAGRRRTQGQYPQIGVRLIPARGETTTSGSPTTPRGEAHPRSRGDDVQRQRLHHTHPGSSPLAGRRPAGRVRQGPRGGLIPARGETTTGRRRRRAGPPAHPRSRGDDARMYVRTTSTLGSSPLAGRRHRTARANPPRGGLIPARGETTASRNSRPASRRAHPRSRGDDADELAWQLEQQGSSPLAGRRQGAAGGVPGCTGLIPARGETTPPRRAARRASTAHPRSRGDDGLVPRREQTRRGSSPLAGRRPA